MQQLSVCLAALCFVKHSPLSLVWPCALSFYFFFPLFSFLHNCALWFLFCLHLQLNSWCQIWAFFSGPTYNLNQQTLLSSSANCTTDRADVQLHLVIGISRLMNQSSGRVNSKHQKESQKTLCPYNPVMVVGV